MKDLVRDFANIGNKNKQGKPIGDPKDVDEIVLDPFMGSGTTLVACEEMGVRGVGIEMNPDYLELCCKRVKAATLTKDMFVHKPTYKPVKFDFDALTE